VRKTKILVSLPNDLIEDVDSFAEDCEFDRSEAIELILTYFMDHEEEIVSKLDLEGDEGEEDEEEAEAEA